MLLCFENDDKMFDRVSKDQTLIYSSLKREIISQINFKEFVLHLQDSTKSAQLNKKSRINRFNYKHLRTSRIPVEYQSLITNPRVKRVLLKKKNKNYGFGLTRLVWKIGLLCLPLLLISIYDWQVSLKDAHSLQNLTDLVSFANMLWASLREMKFTLLSMIIHKDRINYRLGKPSDYYKKASQKLQNELLPRLIELKHKDLGSVRPIYEELTHNLSLCDALALNGNKYAECGAGPTTHYARPLPRAIEGIINNMDSVFLEAQALLAQHSWQKDLLKLLQKPVFYSFLSLSRFDNLTAEIYYTFTLLLEQSLKKEYTYNLNFAETKHSKKSLYFSEFQKGFVQLWLVSSVFVIALIFFFAYTTVVIPFIETIRSFQNICLMMSWTIILQNPLLRKHFRD